MQLKAIDFGYWVGQIEGIASLSTGLYSNQLGGKRVLRYEIVKMEKQLLKLILPILKN